MHVSTPLLPALVAAFIAAMGSLQGVDRKDLLVIEGAKDPAQIPEWLAWEHSFTVLNLWHGKDSGFTHDLREALSPAEFELLEKEAAAHRVRETRRASKGAMLTEKYPYATTTDPKIVARANDEAFEIDLEYRREILASRDRLLQAFSVESQAALLDWVAENKAAITSYVQKPDLKRWRMPE
jgi:hypothetical protein